MWKKLNHLPHILVGQRILSYLDLKSVVKLETALTSAGEIQTLHSFLFHFSKAVMKVHIPEEMSKLKWLQSHVFPITRVIVYLDKINDTFETNMINEIELVDNCLISSTTINFLPNNIYENVIYICFKHEQDVLLMEELFSRLCNLRELTVGCRPNGWIQNALQALHRESNNNVLIENLNICTYNLRYGSVAEIAKYCPKLQSLSVRFDIAEDSILALSMHCPLLKELNIPHILKISSKETASLCAPVLSCIHSISTPNMFVQVNPHYYAITISYLTELRKLKLEGFVDDTLVPIISQYCLKLENVIIHHRSTSTPTQLLQLAQNCQHLHTIELSHSDFSNDELIIGLAERCPNLQTLSHEYFLQYITNTISDACLLALSKHCPNLRELDFRNCTTITEVGILQLIHHCKHLYRLILPCSCLSEDTVLALPVTVTKEFSVLTLTFNID